MKTDQDEVIAGARTAIAASGLSEIETERLKEVEQQFTAWRNKVSMGLYEGNKEEMIIGDNKATH